MTEPATILNQTQHFNKKLSIALIVSCCLFFIISLELVGAGFQHLGQGFAEAVFRTTSNPFIGFFIGLLVTAILQSSSTTTTMAVALVASNALPLTHAVPIVIGANVGTTLTSTLVSLSYIHKSSAFVKAFSAGIIHDLFNIMVVLMVFPLELKYQLLSKISAQMAHLIPISKGTLYIQGIDNIFEPVNTFLTANLGGILTIILGLIILFTTVKVISQLLYKKWVTQRERQQAIFRNRFQSFSWGLIITSAIQSSSLSTSLMVPLVATDKVNIQKAFAFIIGANIGTTVTAIIAALFKSEVALSLAIAHFIFNMVGCLVFLSIPVFFKLATYLSEQLGMLTLRKRAFGLAYIMITFFILPFTLIYASQTKSKETAQIESVKSEKLSSDLQD